MLIRHPTNLCRLSARFNYTYLLRTPLLLNIILWRDIFRHTRLRKVPSRHCHLFVDLLVPDFGIHSHDGVGLVELRIFLEGLLLDCGCFVLFVGAIVKLRRISPINIDSWCSNHPIPRRMPRTLPLLLEVKHIPVDVFDRHGVFGGGLAGLTPILVVHIQ